MIKMVLNDHAKNKWTDISTTDKVHDLQISNKEGHNIQMKVFHFDFYFTKFVLNF